MTNAEIKEKRAKLTTVFSNSDFRREYPSSWKICEKIVGADACDKFYLCNGNCPFYEVKESFDWIKHKTINE